MEILPIVGEERTGFGGTKNRALVRQGKVPGVLYGKQDGKNKVVHFQVDATDLVPLRFAPYFITLKVKNETYRCILQAKQTHPVSDITTHIDLLLIKDDKPIVMDIPLQLEGKSLGEKEGGMLVKKLRKLKITSLPGEMPSMVTFDVSELRLGKTAKIRALKPAKYKILNHEALPIASVEIPRALRSKAGEAGIDLEAAAESTTEAAAPA